jgi:WD40 repeat protein
MAARLEQARQRLRECLARRGYAVGAAGLAAALAAGRAEAALPLPLVANTVAAAVWFAGERAAGAGFASAGAVALARGACRAMLLSKVRLAAAALLAAALLGAGATVLLRAAAPPTPPVSAAPRPAPDAAGERLPGGAVARLGTTRLRHGDAVYFAAYTPDGKSLVTAGRDRAVRLWDLSTGKEIRRFTWSRVQPDGKPEASRDGPFERQQQQALDDIALSSQAALSADGKVIAASRGGVVQLWETATGTKLHHLQTGVKRLVHLAFSADGKTLVTVGPSGQAVAFWEVATGKCLRRIRARLPAGYNRSRLVPVTEQNAIVSPGSKYLAYQWREPSGVRRIHVRELATGKELPPIHIGGYGGTLAFCFSADDRTLMWDDWYWTGGVVFSDVTTGKELRRLGDKRRKDGTYPERPEETLALAVSPDGRSLAVCRQSHTIELWDTRTGKLAHPAGKPTQAQLYHWFSDYVGALVRPALAFSPDGKKLAGSLGGPAIRQFEADTGREIPGAGNAPRAAPWALALSADGKSLCTFGGDDAVRVWDWTTGKETRQERLATGATHAVFATEGRFAFAVGNQVTLRGKGGTKTWRLAAGEFPPLLALALSPDGEVLATRSYDDPEIRLYNANGKLRSTLGRRGEGPTFIGDGTREVAGVVTPDVVFSPDGRHLAGAGPRRQLCLWDVTTGKLVWEIPPRAGQVIERFAFSPTGLSLASIQSDGAVTLYEAASGARRARFGEADRKHQRVYLAYNYYGKSRLTQATRRAAPVCLAYSPDGRYLATAQETPAIRVWDILAGKQVGRVQGHEGGVVSLLFSADGKHLFSGGADTTVLSWDLARLTKRPAGRSARLNEQALEALWGDLAGGDAARAFAAMRRLCASPEQAVRLIGRRIRPAAASEAGRMAVLIAELGSDRFEVRRRAHAELHGLGELAEPALRKALADDPPLGVRQRLERLLNVPGKAPPPARLRELRAVEVLELIGSVEARRVLRSLAEGAPNSRLTREAGRTSQRLSKRTVGR